MKLNTLRPRRLRRTEAIRSMVRENSLELNDFVYPIFVVPGTNVKEEIPSMPGQYHLSVDNAVKVAEEIYKMGIPAVEVFGLPEYNGIYVKLIIMSVMRNLIGKSNGKKKEIH